MGKTLMGSSKQTGSAPLVSQQAQDFLSQTLQGQGQQANSALGGFLQPQSPDQFQDLFQQSFVDPAMLTFEQDVLPSIQQRFVDQGAGSSSALNQALARSATDLTTMLGGQMGGFMQNQQGNQLNALQLLAQMSGQRTTDPIIQQRQGILGPLIGAAGKFAGGGF